MADGSTFAQAFTILFREGLEALLVIAALAAFLRRAGATDRIGPLYAGAGAAVLASLGMAWVFETYFDGNHNDLIEAGVMLLAAGLMFMMSGWLFLRQDPKAWQADLNRMAGQALGAGAAPGAVRGAGAALGAGNALGAGSALGAGVALGAGSALGAGAALSLAGIAFLAVFREGAETVLFLHALARTANGWDASLLGGLGAAVLALGALFAAMQWLALRLPLRPIFLLTSALLFVMGLKLVGAAIQELQEQTLVPVHDGGVPEAVAALGFNGSWEALGLQGVIVVAALACLLVLQRGRDGAKAAPGLVR
ncbi:Ferrous iron permease EfeU [Methylobacterium crusticola]|uniref:Ferrous iron permease EfeU n=1 Tax=Methylobacterium crusticola TaxID=1697972 RepID=A0ABQ4R249_9HYPH|nr:FTR1 family protein [Methylobacterium crusticola]GJD50916.1 Ferrous iron permease EfeU [Methylobacterium crusticola]